MDAGAQVLAGGGPRGERVRRPAPGVLVPADGRVRGGQRSGRLAPAARELVGWILSWLETASGGKSFPRPFDSRSHDPANQLTRASPCTLQRREDPIAPIHPSSA